jgi:hypothetical protein
MMPTRENIQVNGKLPLQSTVDKLPLHSTVEPQTTGPARETAPKISRLEPPAVPPREAASKVSEFEPPTIPLVAFETTSLVSLLLYTPTSLCNVKPVAT